MKRETKSEEWERKREELAQNGWAGVESKKAGYIPVFETAGSTGRLRPQ